VSLFKYKARSQRGDLLEGALEAGSARAVAAQLLSGGVTPIEIVEAPSRPGAFTQLRRLLGERRPSRLDLLFFSRQMYTLTRSGVPLVRGMRSLAESARNPTMAVVLQDVTENLESGRELSAALARHPRVFPSLLVSTVRVGESTGRLDEAFGRISQYLELDRETRQRVQAALRYPALVLAAMAIAVAVINVFVVPAFAQVFERTDVPLPWATRVLVGVSDFFVNQWPALLGGVVAAALGLRVWVATPRGRYRWDKTKLRLPLVGGIIQRATLARFARAFALSLHAGVPLVQGLSVVARATDNEYVSDRVLEMRNGIERGESLTRTTTATGMFTPLVLQMVAVGEETGAVDELLDEVAAYYEREVEYDLKNLSSTIEPVVIVAVGMLVLVLALGVFLPMWDLAVGVGLREG